MKHVSTSLVVRPPIAWGKVQPNPSIERTSPGKPGAAPHVKR